MQHVFSNSLRQGKGHLSEMLPTALHKVTCSNLLWQTMRLQYDQMDKNKLKSFHILRDFIIPTAIIPGHKMKHKMILYLDMRGVVRYTLQWQTDMPYKYTESCGPNSDELKHYSETPQNSAIAPPFIYVLPTWQSNVMSCKTSLLTDLVLN